MTRQEVIGKVAALVANRYGGDFHKAFDFYAKGTGTVRESEVINLLEHAGVGSGLGARLVRYAAAGEIIDTLDTDGDGAIQWGEFDAVFSGKVAAAAAAPVKLFGFVVRENSTGKLYYVVAKNQEDVYHVFGREVYGMVEPMDSGNVDVDLWLLPDLKAAGVVAVPLEL